MACLVLVGPFLTRNQLARRARIPARQAALRPDLLRVRGPWLEEAYFEFQLDERGIRPDLGSVVQSLKEGCDDLAIADWLVCPHAHLQWATPLQQMDAGADADSILVAAKELGPIQ